MPHAYRIGEHVKLTERYESSTLPLEGIIYAQPRDNDGESQWNSSCSSYAVYFPNWTNGHAGNLRLPDESTRRAFWHIPERVIVPHPDAPTPAFQAFDVGSKQPFRDSDGRPATFSTGPLAAEFCKHASAQLGSKIQPRRIAPDTDWQAREATRMVDGTYKPLPPYLAYIAWPAEHYLHMAEGSEGMVAYTKDDPKGAADIQTRTSLQGYLQSFGAAAGLSASVIEYLITQHEAATLKDDGLQFATEPDDIADVYTHPGSTQTRASCMRLKHGRGGRDDIFNTPVHPCSIYGAGDLAIAYLGSIERGITHRALCWPDKLIYSRMYGPDDRLHRALKKRGYEQSAYYGDGGETFNGARVLRIVHDDISDCYVMPYIDDQIGFKLGPDKKYLVLSTTSNDGDTRRTDGWSCEPEPEEEEDGRELCANCEEYIYETYAVRTGRYAAESWCINCRDNNAFHCDSDHHYYSNNADSYEMANGDTWSEYAFVEYGYTCFHDGLNYDRRRNPPRVLPDDSPVHPDNYDAALAEYEEARLRELESAANLPLPFVEIQPNEEIRTLVLAARDS